VSEIGMFQQSAQSLKNVAPVLVLKVSQSSWYA